jgi:hypothetical protein
MTEDELDKLRFRHLNLLGLTYEDQCNLFAEIDRLNELLNKHRNESGELRGIVEGMALRIHAQSELLSKRAEKSNGT